MLKKTSAKIIVAIVVIIALLIIFGPKPATPVYGMQIPAVPADAALLETFIKSNESKHKLKPNNEARIVWYNDSLKQKTKYAIVYLHGFSASQEEGRPIHTNIAKEFGCNLYLSRLAEHGVDTSAPLANLTPSLYWESAKEALAIGKQIGENVILMGTSTGGTNALQLAANYPKDVSALILLSPNIALFHEQSWLLNDAWGLQIATMINGGDSLVSADERPLYKQYWYSSYPLKAATELEEYLETTMTKENFNKVKQPLLMLYYYKDEVHQDSTVSVPAMLTMFDELGTPRDKKIKQAIPNAGSHVLGSYIRSKDLLSVQRAVEAFMDKKLDIPKVNRGSFTTVSY
ncbi:MAG: alpha/beta hydrolase [Chitinophagaceae bacterium]|nr:alpha/beta hydrolase [Chitinophagaceae bacterium]